MTQIRTHRPGEDDGKVTPGVVPDSESADLAHARAEARALLHEVDHRVKNNLQLICSLILLQSRRIDDGPAREALRSVLERVTAISIVHRRLFQNEDIERFDIAQFVRDLAEDLIAVSGRDDIQVRLDLQPIQVPAAQAAPLALVVNELIANALRHAFPEGHAGTLDISVRRLNGDFEIVVRDDGVGMSDPAAPAKGFGLTIADLLCRQLNADCSFLDGEPGVRATVRLPVNLNLPS